MIKNPELGKQRKFKSYPSKADRSNCQWRCYGKKMTTEDSVHVISMNDEHTCVSKFKYGTLVSYKWIGRHFESNPCSTVKVGVTVNPDDKTYFDRFYVCFKGLKDEWKLGCRKIIALDGCFLKRPSVGEILTAIGRDANNHIFLMAWAVVNVENKDKWSWCLDLLGDELDMPTGNGLTLMSDQHKGLIEAVKELMPHAEHRQCARHIYEGFRKHYSGDVFRQLFWVDSKATYPGMSNKIMEKIKRANLKAYDYLVKKEPKTWSMAYFHIGTNCEAIENRFSECFDLVILSVRSKPRITMLEAMRDIVFGKNAYYEEFMFWHVIPTGGHLFVVKNGSEAFNVDEHHRNCTCRLWQLSSLPCCYAIAVIFKLNRLPDCSYMSSILPPKPRIMLGRPRTMPGRPRKKRIKAAHENKNPKQGRPRKTLEVGSSLIDKDIDTPVAKEQFVQEQVVKEQASDFDVGGSTENDVRGSIKNDVGGSSEFDVRGSSDVKGCNQFGLRRGRRVKKTVKRGGAGYKRGSIPARRFSKLSRWFGLGKNDMESDPIEES
ncbi:pentatricopeptide repeat-containing protein [Tanacetum coccineum]